MNELIVVWKKPKMVKTIALTALIYAAIIIPIKGITFIPYVGNMRPGAFVPVLAGFIFGPAGAWGAAFGNLIGDLFGTFNLESIFGFAGNLMLAYLPYKIWYHIFRKNKSQLGIDVDNLRDLLNAFLSGILGNLLAAFIIAWGTFSTSDSNFMHYWISIITNNSLSMILLIPCLKWFVPASRNLEIDWTNNCENFCSPTSTPTKQFYLIGTMFFTSLGTLIFVGISLAEIKLHFGSSDYWFYKSIISWIGAGCLALAIIFALKE